MLAVRFHGRGGQGAVVASKLLAAALFREGWYVQAFPSFGAERTGAPVTAFLRADTHRITIHSQITHPTHVIVLDPLLMAGVDVTAGLEPGGLLLVNSPRPPEALDVHGPFQVATCDGTAIALRHHLGTRTAPIVNTAVVGAFVGLTHVVAPDILLAVIPEVVPLKPEANQAAAREAFEQHVRTAAVTS